MTNKNPLSIPLFASPTAARLYLIFFFFLILILNFGYFIGKKRDALTAIVEA